MGWFPLNRRSSRLMHLATGDKITGSVQLRVRWVHSPKAFLYARVQALEVRGNRAGADRCREATLYIASSRKKQSSYIFFKCLLFKRIYIYTEYMFFSVSVVGGFHVKILRPHSTIML